MEVKKIRRHSFRTPRTGSFGLENKTFTNHPANGNPVQWVYCRETFARRFHTFPQDAKNFYFCCGKKGIDRFSKFISKTEQIISGFSSNCSQSTFEETNLNYAIWINPSNFWKNCQIRMSLFSILLRCGSLYNPEEDNYEEALFSQDYSKRTKPAVMRFLFGFTNFNGEQQNQGWVRTFENKKILELRNSLISDKKEFLFLGKNSLWT
jgi:hypothetical protein